MRKRIAAILVAAALAGGINAGFAIADPGPNGHNDYGLCRALSNNGKKNGWYKDGHDLPPPFAAFDTDEDGEISDDEFDAVCEGATPGGK